MTRFAWIIFLVVAWGWGESYVSAQLIPRRGVTRPCPTHKIPNANYEIGERSASLAAVSNRYVYLDNPLDVILGQTGDTGSTQITTISTEKEVSNTNANGQAVIVTANDLSDSALAALAVSNDSTATEGENSENSSTGASNGSEPVDSSTVVPLTTGKITEKTTKVIKTIPNTTNDSNRIQRDKKLFQWRQNSMKIDHCEVSNMALQLNRNGDWILSLRGDQNRVSADDPNRFNPTLHIKRNQFTVKLRCFGNASMATTDPDFAAAGKPIMAEIDPKPFWVENREPRYVVASGNNGWVKTHFDFIDRVELEFFYKK